MSPQPRTVAEAVTRLRRELPADTLDYIRGTPSPSDLVSMHFGLGMYIRNAFGLWHRNPALLVDCGLDPGDGLAADEASQAILEALRHDLLATASAEERERGRQVWERSEQERAAVRERQAAKDALITSRRCSRCGKPCPRYCVTCKYCEFPMGREVEG